MSEVLLPTWIIPEEEPQEPLDEGSSVFRGAFAPGIAQRQSFGGLRLKLSRKHTVRAEEKAQLLSTLRSTRGSYNTLRTKVHFALRGSFPAPELVSNNTFANGTTGWSAGSGSTLSVQDRMLRVLRTSNASAGTAYAAAPSVTTVQYAPYAWRVFVSAVRGNVNAGVTYGGNAVVVGSFSNGATPGMYTTTFMATSTSGVALFADNPGALVSMAGDYFDVSYSSCTRCALIDNGANLLLRSDEFDNASWSKVRSTATANATVAPDGQTTADTIAEDTSNNTHFVQQDVTVASAVADYSFSVALKAVARTWAKLSLFEATGSSAISCYFDLSTGATGTQATGGNWSNLRVATSDLGNGYYQCTITGRKTNAATTLQALISVASADNVDSYLGITNGIRAWRATLAQSSFPTRLVQTTSAAQTATAQTGNAFYLKGLPASTADLLLPEDYFAINGEVKQATAALRSDAAGLGYLQFEPALVRSPADNDPVIVTDPFGKFLMSGLKVDNEFATQAVVTYDLEHIYE